MGLRREGAMSTTTETTTGTTSWADGYLLGFDTETTGVDVQNDRIVTVALIESTGPGRGGELARTWLINPGVPIPEGAAAVHGITTEHAVAHGDAPAPLLDEVASRLADAMLQGIPVVAYNASFDLQILDSELQRHGLPTVVARLGRQIGPVIDPLVIDRAKDRYRKGKRTLSDLVALHGIQQDGRLHTADVDVSATLDVLRALARRYPALAATSLETLHCDQIGWHRAWAEGFNRYLAFKGRDADVSLDSPVPAAG